MICNSLFEMYFMETAGNLPFVIVRTGAEVAQGLNLSQTLMKPTATSSQTESTETRTDIHCRNFLYAIQKAFFLSKLHISISKRTAPIHTAQKQRCFDRVHRYSIKISFFLTSEEVQRVSVLATQDFILISTMSVTSTKDDQRKGSWEINVCHL